MSQQSEPLIKQREFAQLDAAGLIVHPSVGGMLHGPSKYFGGIPTLVKTEAGYVPGPEAEGFMFLVNASATCRFWQILQGINNIHLDMERPDYMERLPDCMPSVIHCSSDDPNGKYGEAKYLLLDAERPMFLVNRYSTWRHMELLDWINTVEPYYTFKIN